MPALPATRLPEPTEKKEAPCLPSASIPIEEPTLSMAAVRLRKAWLLLLPMLCILILVAAWPLAKTILNSFTNATLNADFEILNADSTTLEFPLSRPAQHKRAIILEFSPEQNIAYTVENNRLFLKTPPLDDSRITITYKPAFVGLENYYYLVQDSAWWRATYNTIFFAVVSVTLETILGLMIALSMNTAFRGKGLLRTAVLIPWAIPTIVSAQMWGWMYNDIYGILNHLMLAVGLITVPIAWTADPNYSLWGIILVDVWKTTPFMALLILAALQLLPNECYEAAKVDGIHPVRVFFKVTLPLIKPALMVAIIFRLLDALRVFDLIYVLTSNSRDTMSMSVYVRQQLIDFGDTGYGSAAATLLFMIIAGLTALYMVAARVGKEGK